MSGRRWLTVAEVEVVQPTNWIARVTLIATGLGIGFMFAVAWCLVPDARGFGTHEQLGLPPCSSRLLWGSTCPSCGMTTSWCWLVRGNLYQAARANAGGLALGLCAMAAAPWLVVSGFRGRWAIGFPRPWLTATAVATAAVLSLASWLQNVYG